MIVYVLRRVLYAVPTLLGVSVLTFVLFYVVVPPNQLARQNLTIKNPTPQDIEDWKRQHGYDKPLPEQMKKHLTELFLFRFGKSDVNGDPIGPKVRRGAGPSLALAVPEFFASLFVTVALGLFVSYYRATYVDYWGVAICVLLMSVNYVLYIIFMQYVFAKLLRVFPLEGYAPGLEGWKFIVLPALVGLVSGLGGAVRYNRAAFVEEMNQDYVRTARSRGVPEGRILFTHVLKNAATPILTAVVLGIPFLFMGNLLMENFFGIPGLGSMTLDAINSSDFAVIRTMVFLGTIAYIIGVILTDISYAVMNPRVRLE